MSRKKTRDVNDPYAVYIAGDWEFRVLKHYQNEENETNNPYARVFTAVKSPMTWGGYDLGDSYLKDITQTALLVYTRYGDQPIFNAGATALMGTQYNLETW